MIHILFVIFDIIIPLDFKDLQPGPVPDGYYLQDGIPSGGIFTAPYY